MRFNYLAHLANARKMSADKGGGSGGSKPTLEEQLTAAKSELDTLRTQATSLTGERDKASADLATAQAEVTRLTAQFTEATNTATALKAERDKLTTDLAAMTTDRDSNKKRADSAETNVTRLESLCGVKGVDPKGAVPAVEEKGNVDALRERLKTETDPKEKHRLAQEIKELTTPKKPAESGKN